MKKLSFFIIFLIGFQIAFGQVDSVIDTSDQSLNSRFPFLPVGVYGIHIDSVSRKITCFLPQDMEVKDYLCRGGKHNNWMTSFWFNGNLALCWLARDQTIQGVPAMRATMRTEFFRWLPFTNSARVEFYFNGQLKRCKIAIDTIIQGRSFSRGDVILFDETGKLIH